jgi:hypothetical protein
LSGGLVIAEPEKNPLEKLCVSLREYRGRSFVDIRLHFLGDDDVWHPTKKGITMGLALWPDFVAAIQCHGDRPPGPPRDHPD